MSQERKTFVRPKVRFSQDDARKSLDDKAAASKSKPKITSIVRIDKPVKIVPMDLCKKIEDVRISDDAPEALQPRKGTGRSSDKDDQRPLVVSDNDRESPKLSDDNSRDDKMNVPPLKLHGMQDKKSQKASEVASSESAALMKKTTVLQGKKVNVGSDVKGKGGAGKENKGPVERNAQLSEQNQYVNTKSRGKAKASNAVSTDATRSCTGVIKEVKHSGTAKPPCRNLGSRPVAAVTAVMPCQKYKKVLSKTKALPVKKTIMRDIIGKDIKPYVGPGVIHKKQRDYNTAGTVKSKQIKHSVSSEKLAKPEYNSIMCTISKLKEVKKEKVVPDVEHLPSAYKDLINRKVSMTLDFPFEETVFRNLIDLSIDEKQFPSRMMRSKDPEPRQRDIVPKLSDFFVPEALEEYCVPVSAKPRVPEIQNKWNAFRTHEKLLQWKESVDGEE